MKRKLKLDDLQKKDSGKYTCSATLAFNGSQIERSFELKVEGNYGKLISHSKFLHF